MIGVRPEEVLSEAQAGFRRDAVPSIKYLHYDKLKSAKSAADIYIFVTSITAN